MDTKEINESRKPLPTERLLSLSEVAKWLGIHYEVLRVWVSCGAVRGMKVKGSRWKMSHEDVRELVSDMAVGKIMRMPAWKRRTILGASDVADAALLACKYFAERG